MTGDVSIRVRDLNHSFGKGGLKKQILFDINAEIPAGEIVIVTGPSGSGKTTLLTIVSALRSVQEGSVEVLGLELHQARASALERAQRQIGFIFQQHNLVASLSALQNVELGLRVSGRFKGAALRKRAEEYLQTVGLAERLKYKPEALSGGQRQRVAIARALASEPAILMADEPTASLDKQSGRDVVDHMKKLAKEHGTTILLVTHDNRILDIADRIVYLEDGRLSTFTDAVIDNSQQMMRVVADTKPMEGAEDSNFDFQYLLVETSLQTQRVLALKGRVNDMAFRSIMLEALQGATKSLVELMNADMALILLYNEEARSFEALPASKLPPGLKELPAEQGAAVATLESGDVVTIEDTSTDPRYSAEIDQRLFMQTGTLISAPFTDRNGKVFAVAQLRASSARTPFDGGDERNFCRFVDTIKIVIEQCR